MKEIFASTLKLGSLELNKLQDISDLNSTNPLKGIIEEYGFVIPLINEGASQCFDQSWVLDNTQGDVLVGPGTIIIPDDNERPRGIKTTAISYVHASVADGLYNIIASYNSNNYETGTVSITAGSTAVVGSGTEFTKIFGTNRSIIINNVAYAIQSVTDITHLTLVESFSGGTVSSVQFKVGGWFTTPPASVNDYIIYEYDALQFSLKASAPSTGEYLLGQVNISGGVVTNIYDKRDKNRFKLRYSFDKDQAAYCTNNITQSSTTISVPTGQLRNFPDSYTTDKTHYYIITDAGTLKGFSFTGRYANQLTGVSFASGNFTASTGSYLFKKDTKEIISTNLLEMGGSLLDIPISGIYTPTFTANENLATAPVGTNFSYLRIGNIVTVAGAIRLTPTAGAPTQTSFYISLPIASSIAEDSQLAGTIVADRTTFNVGRVSGGQPGESTAFAMFNASFTSNTLMYIHFTYRIT